jgi:hypothetical protein
MALLSSFCRGALDSVTTGRFWREFTYVDLNDKSVFVDLNDKSVFVDLNDKSVFVDLNDKSVFVDLNDKSDFEHNPCQSED